MAENEWRQISNDPETFKTFLRWLRMIEKQRGIVSSAGGGRKIEAAGYPLKYLTVLSVLSGFRIEAEGSKVLLEAHEWMQKVQTVNGGVFDPVKLYDLMKREVKK